ncbi:MAG: plasminogen-binding N-terminal domain-containing protein [Sulfurovaceae bacterium]|nr:plasminogen-binding N-terminal domain-containing protein [Sulfurovaceae bacterium]
MKKFLFLLLVNYTLFADALPTPINTTITSINDNMVKIATSIPQGTSGIVIHNYGNKLSAITHILVSKGGQQATIHPYIGLGHENLPSIKSNVEKGDKVIFGNFYNNVLLIAPNEKTYSKTIKTLQRNFIHPDIYAMDLIINNEKEISFTNLKDFAHKNQVGLILITTKENIMVFDPLSSEYLTKLPLTINSTGSISPFYARFGQISNSIFGTKSQKIFSEYYQGIGQIK